MATNPFGPVQIMVLGFSGSTLNAEVKKQFNALRKQGLIRVIDFTYLAKAEDGKITTRQATDFSDADRVKLGATVGALIGYGAAGVEGAEVLAEAGAMSAAEKEFGMSKEDLMNVADGLPRGSSAAVLLIEHVWAKKFISAVRTVGGTVLYSGMLSAEVLVSAGANLAEAAAYLETSEEI